MTDEQIRALRKASELLCGLSYNYEAGLINDLLAARDGQSAEQGADMVEYTNEDLMRLVFVGGKEYELVKREIMCRLQDGRATLNAPLQSAEPSCPLKCKTECKAELHGCASECQSTVTRRSFASQSAEKHGASDKDEAYWLRHALRQIATWPDGGSAYGHFNIKRFAKQMLETIPPSQAENRGEEGALPGWFHMFIRNIAEIPDRNSPEDWPEAMIVTEEELRICMLNAIEDYKNV